MSRWQRQGYERWPDTLWRAVGLKRVHMALALWWFRTLPGPVPYLLQPGYGLRYQLWFYRMRVAHRWLHHSWAERGWKKTMWKRLAHVVEADVVRRAEGQPA